jgi:AraC-like DNA-binding protein
MNHPVVKIEAIATSAGFTDSAAFAKAVKRRAGCSATV